MIRKRPPPPTTTRTQNSPYRKREKKTIYSFFDWSNSIPGRMIVKRKHNQQVHVVYIMIINSYQNE